MLNESIFREYDIRGVAGKDIDRATAVEIGKAFACLLREMLPHATQVSVGKDVRNSSESLASGIIEGITSAGIDVYDINTCPTPVQYFSLFHLDLDGGIMVTGSHNPPEYNGFKISIGKETIHGKDIQKLKKIIQEGKYSPSAVRGTVKQYDMVSAYKEYMLNEFSYLNGPGSRKLKVVIDAGNGTAGLVVPEILDNIGCETISLFCEPDGNFPNHHPDPTVLENIQDLIKQTMQTGADIGIGYDGDSDRIGVVDSDGNIIWGDQLMIVLSRALLKERPGSMIIGDVKCSQVMFDDIEKHGGTPVMWKTGHSLVKQKMRDEGAPLAGEFSGHIFIGDRYFGYDDAIYTTLRLIEIMKQTGKNINGLLADVPRMFFTPEIRIDCPDDRKKAVVDKVIARFTAFRDRGGSPYKIMELNTLDGIRVLFEKGWGLVRTSNTQPVVVMRVEAEDEGSLNGYRTFMENVFKAAMEEK